MIYILIIQTESGDYYYWTFDHYPTPSQIAYVKERDLGEEYEYVADMNIVESMLEQ